MRRCSEPFSACAAWTRWTPTLGGGLTPKKPDLKMKISRSRVEAAIAAPDIRSRSFPNAVLLPHVCANNLHQFLHISMFAAIACVLFLNISQLVSGSKI
jgi:hypothetical protein